MDPHQGYSGRRLKTPGCLFYVKKIRIFFITEQIARLSALATYHYGI